MKRRRSLMLKQRFKTDLQPAQSKATSLSYKPLAFALAVISLFFLSSSIEKPLTRGKECLLETDSKVKIATDYYSKHPKNISLLDTPKQKPAIATKQNYSQVLDKQVVAIIKDTPMEKMSKDIAKQDRAVAAYIVGIAMKESKFGKFSPKKNGADCYNYWGYRGKENPTKSGYSCFNSPSHAVSVVGGKIATMLTKGSKNPAQMISWKCGRSCAGHDPVAVQKWIDDVAINYYKLNPSTKRELAKNSK